MSRAGHLVRRFLTSLRPGPVAPDDDAWARRQLLPGEVALWERMSRPDRRHAVEVARRVDDGMSGSAPRAVLAAALTHDVGKVEAGLGTYGRVVATLSGAVAGHDTASLWSARRGFTRRVGLYLRHPELGADMLQLAGSDPLGVAWAREHHLPEEQWTVPVDLGRRLAEADDD